jgi:Tol biopolymer transport system component/plastocyanin
MTGRFPGSWGLRLGVTALVVVAFAAVAIVAIRRRDNPVAKASLDSLAPPGAPAHWLPPEDWVYNHWLPYDEGRLYALLAVTRGDIWRQLRDDRHTLAELAQTHGWSSPSRLASALVEARRGHVSADMLSVLRARALRTITQGHLAQHLFFHSLHQFAIPSEAPEIFGVTDAEFRALRRGEQSPLEIGRVHGRSPSEIEALTAEVLRERARAGIRSGAMTARQGRLLLARQLAQLPRWLAQVRYNGPPQTHEGKLVRLPRDYAANPSISGNGLHVVFEAYQQHLPLALTRGEISVQERSAGAAAPSEISQANTKRRGPQSTYNPSVSADGRLVVFESADGNRNFAKRYGSIRVFVRDLRTGVRQEIGRPSVAVSRSEFNPVIASDGSTITYQAVGRSGHTEVFATRWPSQRIELVSRRGRGGPAANADTYEPVISGDGNRIAFTTAASNLGAPVRRSQVFMRDRRRGTTVQVSHARGYASSPAISADGRRVAFVARDAAGTTQIYLSDLHKHTTLRVSSQRDGVALGPAVSASGRFVAYTAVRDNRSTVMLRDIRRAVSVVVSRATGHRGALARGDATDASISGDGRRVAFSSTATNLSSDKPDDRRGVFVRDMRRGTTTLVSAKVAPTADSAAPPPPQAPELRSARAALGARQIAIVDNAFNHGDDRPLARLHAGQRLTWLWRSRQSHQVTLASGPGDVRSPTQSHGRFSIRLTRPGIYRFVCSIHAPGMRMTAVVR